MVKNPLLGETAVGVETAAAAAGAAPYSELAAPTASLGGAERGAASGLVIADGAWN